jgi:hypothetical protein
LFDRGPSLTILHRCCSLQLWPGYNGFRGGLQRALDESTPPTANDKNINVALKVLQTKKESKEDEAGQPQTPVGKLNNALEILVYSATEEFSFAPRDVYDDLLEFDQTKERHTTAVVELKYDDLEDLVQNFSASPGLDRRFSPSVIAVYPRPSKAKARFDKGAIDFKSIRIAKQVVESMRSKEDRHLREMYRIFHGVPASSTLAGWIFEAIVYRMFSCGEQSKPSMLQFIRMISNDSVPPVSSTGPSSSTSDTSLPSSPTPDTPLSSSSTSDTSLSSFKLRYTGTRAATPVDFTDSQLSDVTLESDIYYITTAASNPLSYSFTINIDPLVVGIYIFQITASKHKGLGKGYQIRKIIDRVRGLPEQEGSHAHTFWSAPAVGPATGCRCPSAGVTRPEPTTIAGMASIYAFPSRDIMVRHVYSLPILRPS